MSDEYVISLKPNPLVRGKTNDPSAAIFKNGELKFAVEEERLIREKRALGKFPSESVKECMDYCGIGISDVDRILIPFKLSLRNKAWRYTVRSALRKQNTVEKVFELERTIESHLYYSFLPLYTVRSKIEREFGYVPELEEIPHHRCHAASAFYPSRFEEAIVLTVDGAGEHDSTVVWHAKGEELCRIKTFRVPNSLGFFYKLVAMFLGFSRSSGSGKLMGLAPYGNPNEDIRRNLHDILDIGPDYDVTPITGKGFEGGLRELEEIFGRGPSEDTEEFTQWEKDLAYETQKALEDIIKSIVRKYTDDLGVRDIALAGGVALNCKMNRELMISEAVDNVYIQPVAGDAGLALGAGFDLYPEEGRMFRHVYQGPEFSEQDIKSRLQRDKISFEKPENLEETVAKEISKGKLVGWFGGRTELGPRALGNRSILADPRNDKYRKKINLEVKNRENWRPFAPSILEEAGEDYFENFEPSPYMIKAFKVKKEKTDDIPAVLHPSDGTARPQTVRKDQNSRYYGLIKEFEELTGVPVLLNTSFNKSGEPIVNTPEEALSHFYTTGLDLVVLGDYVVRK